MQRKSSSDWGGFPGRMDTEICNVTGSGEGKEEMEGAECPGESKKLVRRLDVREAGSLGYGWSLGFKREEECGMTLERRAGTTPRRVL